MVTDSTHTEVRIQRHTNFVLNMHRVLGSKKQHGTIVSALEVYSFLKCKKKGTNTRASGMIWRKKQLEFIFGHQERHAHERIPVTSVISARSSRDTIWKPPLSVNKPLPGPQTVQ